MEAGPGSGLVQSTEATPVTSLGRDTSPLTELHADNLSSAHNVTQAVTQYTPNVADAPFEKDLRIAILYVEFVLGTIGGLLVFLWLWYNRRRKSRVNALILHVAMSDMSVMVFACLSQLVWEHFDRQWKAGEVMCKIIKFLQSFAMMASNFMLVVLSVDRHQAIRAPLRAPFPVWIMTAIGWALSAVLSVPQLFIFYTNFNNNPQSIFFNRTVCESIWRTRPISERRAYLTFIGVVVFFVPLLIIVVCYVRIFLKIAQKADEGKATKKQTMKPGKVHLQSTPSSSLPKAKIKTLKMTVVIVLTFIICGLPLQVLEMIYSYGNFRLIPSHVASILGGMAVANSATNPFVFLLFNVNLKCLEGFVCGVLPCCAKARDRRFFEATASTRSEFTMNSEISRTASKYSTGVTTDCVEMAVKKKQGTGKKSAANYTLMEATEYDENLGNSANIMPLSVGAVKDKM